MAVGLTDDDEERERYLETLRNGRQFDGFVRFEGMARENLNRYLDGHTQKSIIDLMITYLEQGGKLSKVDENRSNWRHAWKFHHDLWPEVSNRVLYFETRFEDAEMLDMRTILVVNIHPPETTSWD